MANLYGKFCALLAGSDLSLREVENLLMSLQHMDPRMVVDDVRKFNHIIRDFNDHASFFRPVESVPDRESNEVTDKIMSLLFVHSNFPRGYVAEHIYRRLLERDPGRQIPSPHKIGFENWLNRLSQIIPPSELLHVAYSVRDDLSGSSSIDWKLG